MPIGERHKQQRAKNWLLLLALLALIAVVYGITILKMNPTGV